MNIKEWKIIIMLSAYVLVIFLEQIFPYFKNYKQLLKHDLRNFAFALFNALAVALIFSGSYVLLTQWTEQHAFGLLWTVELASWQRLLLALLLFDAWMYAWHRASHRIHFLWRFHRVHHTDRQMDASTALRFHVGEIFISFLVRLPVVALLGLSLFELLMYEALLQPIIIFHHSNVALPEKIDRVLRKVIVTPNMHRVHHSDVPRETHSNFSSIFSWWDKIFSSFQFRENTHEIQFGLPDRVEEKDQSVRGMIIDPLRNN